MRTSSTIALLLGVGLAVGGCETEDVDPVAEQDGMMAPEEAPPGAMQGDTMQMDAMQAAIAMEPIGDSGVSGEATVASDPGGQGTRVEVTLETPDQEGGTHQGHIHQGTCESPGGVVAPLQPITTSGGTGTMTATVQNDAMSFMDGNHIIVYHEAGGSPGQPITCGQIPEHMM